MHQNLLRKIFLLGTEQEYWRKIFPLGIKAIFLILRQYMPDRRATFAFLHKLA